MKLAKIGLVFKILVILVILLSSAFSFLVFQDIRRIGSDPQQLITPSSDFGNFNNSTPSIIKEGGKILRWKISLGSIHVKNTGKYLKFGKPRLKVDVVNKTTADLLLQISSAENVIINAGESKEIDVSLLIQRLTLTKIVTFLFRVFQWNLFQEVNTTFSNTSLDGNIWNSSIFTETVFNKDLFETIVFNGTILNQTAFENIKWETLLNKTAFNESLVSHTTLNEADIAEIDLDLDQLVSTLPTIGTFFDRLLTNTSIEAEFSLNIDIMNLPFLEITIQPNEETLLDLIGGTL